MREKKLITKQDISTLAVNSFDAWEFPQRCAGCGHQDNYDRKFPVAILDANTKLCEFCFADEEE